MEDLALKDLFFACIPVVLMYLLIDWLLRKPRVSTISNKYVVITGCDTGFGRMAVLHLDRLGCHVFAGCLTNDGLMELSAQASEKVVPIKIDVSDINNIRKAYSIISSLIPAGTGLWGLINNAGITGALGPYAWIPDSEVRKVLDVNLHGTMNMVNTFLPLLKAAKGRIINMSSIVGKMTWPYSGPYCMSKHAIESYSDAIRRELYMFSIKVAIIEPGGHMTTFMDKIEDNVQKSWDNLSEEQQEEYGFSYFKQVVFLGTKVTSVFASKTPENVINAYDHALFARYPRIRYLVGRDAWLLRKTCYFPDWLLDFVYQLPGIRAVPECLTKTNEKQELE